MLPSQYSGAFTLRITELLDSSTTYSVALPVWNTNIIPQRTPLMGRLSGVWVVEGAEARGVRYAVTRYDNFFSDRRGLLEYAPVLADYLETRFRRAVLGGNDDYVVLERRRVAVYAHSSPTPVPQSATAQPRPRVMIFSLSHR